MNARRFTGATSREVLAKVKHDLGGDALILTNRPLGDGIEIVAMPGRDLTFDELETAARPTPTPVANAVQPRVVEGILNEIQHMRGLLQRELAALSCTDMHRRNPERARLLRELLAAGFSPQLARRLAEQVAEDEAGEPAMRRIGARLEKSLAVADEDEIVVRGGVYALIGPTGAGKTTTVAKLAARAVVRHGAARVALLTTDSYRIAGHDQLRIYGRILGVSVHVVKDGEDLRMRLADLCSRHLVLIDTMGMSQRDRMVADQAALLAGGGEGVKRLLLVNATCNAATLDEVVSGYGQGGKPDGCILTKIDEAAGLATAVDTVIRHRLNVHYVTTGQRVPEDLHVPNRTYLVHRALKVSSGARAHAPAAEELPMLMAVVQPAAGMEASLA